ncbi:MAG: hypothetical protein WCL46_02995 [Chlorobium sp.]
MRANQQQRAVEQWTGSHSEKTREMMSCELLLSMTPGSLPISERAGSMASTERATSDIISAVSAMNSANPNSGISLFFRE